MSLTAPMKSVKRNALGVASKSYYLQDILKRSYLLSLSLIAIAILAVVFIYYRTVAAIEESSPDSVTVFKESIVNDPRLIQAIVHIAIFSIMLVVGFLILKVGKDIRNVFVSIFGALYGIGVSFTLLSPYFKLAYEAFLNKTVDRTQIPVLGGQETIAITTSSTPLSELPSGVNIAFIVFAVSILAVYAISLIQVPLAIAAIVQMLRRMPPNKVVLKGMLITTFHKSDIIALLSMTTDMARSSAMFINPTQEKEYKTVYNLENSRIAIDNGTIYGCSLIRRDDKTGIIRLDFRAPPELLRILAEDYLDTQKALGYKKAVLRTEKNSELGIILKEMGWAFGNNGKISYYERNTNAKKYNGKRVNFSKKV